MSKTLVTAEYVDKVCNNYFWASTIDDVTNIIKSNSKRSLCIILSQSITFAGNTIPAWAQLIIFSGTDSDVVGIAISPSDLSKVYFLGYSNKYWRCRVLSL